MKGKYWDNPRTQRLNEVFNESGRRSCAAFSKSIDANHRTALNYLDGMRLATNDFLEKVIEFYPQYNREWLLEGRGEKYNAAYVEVRSQPVAQIVGNSNKGDNTIDQSGGKEMKEMYEMLVSSLREQIEVLKKDNDLLHKLLEKYIG